MTTYWERRYARGGTSGAGSTGAEASVKAQIVNTVIREHGVESLLDLGCGDGEVAAGFHVKHYTGYDPSPTALRRCRGGMPDRQFSATVPDRRYDLVLSLDVIFHLVEDRQYRRHLAHLFSHGPLVVVYGTNEDRVGAAHVRHRCWMVDIPSGWRILRLWMAEATGFKRAWLLEAP